MSAIAALTREGWLLSPNLSSWRDEKALVRWRTRALHHEAQEKGRGEVFLDYRLRVGEVIGDTSPPAGVDLPEQRLDETATDAGTTVTLIDARQPVDKVTPSVAEEMAQSLGLDRSAAGLLGWDVFDVVLTPGDVIPAAVVARPCCSPGIREPHLRGGKPCPGRRAPTLGPRGPRLQACTIAARRRNLYPRRAGPPDRPCRRWAPDEDIDEGTPDEAAEMAEALRLHRIRACTICAAALKAWSRTDRKAGWDLFPRDEDSPDQCAQACAHLRSAAIKVSLQGPSDACVRPRWWATSTKEAHMAAHEMTSRSETEGNGEYRPRHRSLRD